MPTIEHKRGDTFGPSATYCQDDGTPVSLVGYMVASQLRDEAGNLVVAFDIEIVDAAAGQYRFLPVATSAWPLGTLTMDIVYTTGETIVSTESITVNVIRRGTR